jgi:hypothetical protein
VALLSVVSRVRVDVLQLLYSANHNFTAAFIQYHHSVILNHHPRQAAPYCAVYIYQWRSFKVGTSRAKCPGSGTGIIPGKHSDTRIKPLPLTNDHGRYITVTTERTLVFVGEWPLHITIINL